LATGVSKGAGEGLLRSAAQIADVIQFRHTRLDAMVQNELP